MKGKPGAADYEGPCDARGPSPVMHGSQVSSYRFMYPPVLPTI
jgi:hypothetical protein